MKSLTMSDEPKVETRVIMPSELSLVVTKRPLPPLDRLLPLEECIKICATINKIPAKTRYLPYSGTLRADKLPLIPYLSAYDMRACFGAYDVCDESGRRTCNWIRFLKVTPFYTSDVNIIGQRLGSRNEVLFEVIRDIPFGEELVAFLIPPVGATPEGGSSIGGLPFLTSSLFSSFDSFVADKPLDLSRSLLKAPESDGRRVSTPSPRRSPSSDIEETHSDDSAPSSPSSDNSLSPLHSSSGCPISPTGFLPQSSLSFHNAASVLLAHQSIRFPSIAGILPRIPHGLPTPPSSTSGSPKDSMRESPPAPVPKRRERTMLPCSECGKAFDRPSLLKRHMRTHTGEKPHVCDVCGKGFSTSSSLNTHRRIHSGEKPHQCGVCGKRFTASSNLYYHKMTHIKEKPHKCTLCTRSFPTPGDLRSHMFVHNGQWPHKCGVCGKGFSKLTNLRNHTLLHSTKARINTPTPTSPIVMETEA